MKQLRFPYFVFAAISSIFCLLLVGCAQSAELPEQTADATITEAPAEATPVATPSPVPCPTASYYGAVSKVEEKSFLVRAADGTFQPFFVKGVDIGAAKPGYWPGEFGIEESDYLRWFQLIAEMNANTIRVYVPQMPGFYRALATYNQSAETPLYLLQGIYMNEELIESYHNAFNADLDEIFQRDLKNTIDIIHGNATVEKLPGNAGGEYTCDISEYVIGYLPGIEFSAEFVIRTYDQDPDKTSFS